MQMEDLSYNLVGILHKLSETNTRLVEKLDEKYPPKRN